MGTLLGIWQMIVSWTTRGMSSCANAVQSAGVGLWLSLVEKVVGITNDKELLSRMAYSSGAEKQKIVLQETDLHLLTSIKFI
jgi:hypothetical protein